MGKVNFKISSDFKLNFKRFEDFVDSVNFSNK